MNEVTEVVFTCTLSKIKALAALYRVNPSKSGCVEMAFDEEFGPFFSVDGLSMESVSQVLRFLEKFDRMKAGSKNEWHCSNSRASLFINGEPVSQAPDYSAMWDEQIRAELEGTASK